jgi:hypothetical protein
MEMVSLHEWEEKLTAFLELEAAIRAFNRLPILVVGADGFCSGFGCLCR